MSDRSDEEEDFHPTSPENIAVPNMALAIADTLIGKRLVAHNGNPILAFDYEWLTQHPEVLWLKRKFFINFNEHPNCIYRIVGLPDTWIIDYELIENWTLK